MGTLYALEFDLKPEVLAEYGKPCEQAYEEVRVILESEGLERRNPTLYLSHEGDGSFSQVTMAVNKLSAIEWFNHALYQLNTSNVWGTLMHRNRKLHEYPAEFKMSITFDKTKATAAEIAEHYEYLDKLFAKHKLVKVAEGSYCDSGDKEGYGKMLHMGLILSAKKWFMDCVDTWGWYRDNGKHYEDWAEFFRNHPEALSS